MGGWVRSGVVGPKRGTWWGVRRKLTARLEAMLDRWVSRWWGYEGRMDCFFGVNADDRRMGRPD